MHSVARPEPRLLFRLLGPLEVEVDGLPTPVGPPKQRVLLAALLTAPGLVISTDRLIGELWPEGPPTTASAALQVHVAGLRRVVGDRLRTAGSGYLIDVDPDALDYRLFESLVGPGQGSEDTAAAVRRLRNALGLWRGAAFEAVAGGVLVSSAAARLSQLRQRTREDVAELELQLGRHREVIADIDAWAVESPTAERLVASLMLALHRCGRSGEALAVYDRLQKQLTTEFGIDPEPRVAELAAAIRRRDPTIDPVVAHLPSPPSRFVGRRHELDRAAELLGRGRLLTVTGPGGCGKTRFAIELARETAIDDWGRVRLVELAGHPRPQSEGSAETTALAARAAAALGARDVPGRATLDSLTTFIGDQRMLLLIDNCEHVRELCAELVAHLLGTCPRLRILATSREPLGVDGEVVLPLGGLRTPAAGDDTARALRSDAVRLLVERLAQARGGAGLTSGEEEFAVAVACRLDGLPLAIELAAARLRALSLRDMVDRLDRALDLLVGRSVVDRHRTMRGAIDWSHDLLDPVAQALFRRLGVFVGDFDLPAVQKIGADSHHDAPHELDDVLDPLARLVDRSLVACDPSAARPYRLIQTIREYSLERLTQHDECWAVRRRHAEYVADLVAQPPPMDGPAHAAWLSQMAAHHDDVRAALDWSSDEGQQPELALSIAAAMWWFWWVTGQMAEGRARLDRAIASAGDQPSELRGKALRAAASLARNSGDLPAARRLGESGLQVFLALGDGAGTITALNNLSITAQGQRDYEASLEYGFEALRRAEIDGPQRAVAAALNNTAGTLRCLGRVDEAYVMFTKGLEIFRTIGDLRGEAAALFNLGVVARRRGQLAQAQAFALRCLALYWDLDLVEGQIDGIEAVAYVDAVSGRAESALRLLAVADRERARLGAPIFTPDEIADRQHAEEVARAALADPGDLAADRSPAVESLAVTVRQLLDLGNGHDAYAANDAS